MPAFAKLRRAQESWLSRQRSPTPRELAGWFNAQLIESSWRPTVLTTQLLPYESSEDWKQRESAKDALLVPLVQDLQDQPNERDEKGTVIVFCGSKRNVRSVAAKLAGVRETDLDKLVEACFNAGVGIHFRDAPRAHRAVDAFRQRQIDIIVATSTLATGVNLPALAVIIRDVETGMTPLEVSLAQQMFGRAGRAGHEKAGFAFLLTPSTEIDGWRVRLGDGYTVRSRIAAQTQRRPPRRSSAGNRDLQRSCGILVQGDFRLRRQAKVRNGSTNPLTGWFLPA